MNTWKTPMGILQIANRELVNQRTESQETQEQRRQDEHPFHVIFGARISHQLEIGISSWDIYQRIS